jgi:hypothetical protein
VSAGNWKDDNNEGGVVGSGTAGQRCTAGQRWQWWMLKEVAVVLAVVRSCRCLGETENATSQEGRKKSDCHYFLLCC